MKPLTLLSIVAVIAGCAHADKRPPIIFAPTNPDVASVTTSVSQARANASRASESASRATQIAERIVVAPGQEAELARLKLELSTTVEQLKLAEVNFDNARLRLQEFQAQVEDMKQAAQSLSESVKNERSRADAEGRKAFRNGRERDVFVLLFSIFGAVSAVSAAKPFLWKLAPGWSAIALAATAIGSFVACFTFVRFIVASIVRVTL